MSATVRPHLAALCARAELALDRAAAVRCEPDDRVRLAICVARSVFAGTAPRAEAEFAWAYLFGAEPENKVYERLHTVALQLCMVAQHPFDVTALEGACERVVNEQLLFVAPVLGALESLEQSAA